MRLIKMPKLLEYLKEKNMSHEDVMKLIDKELNKPEAKPDEINKPDLETEVEQVSEVKPKKIYKPELETETITETEEEKPEESEQISDKEIKKEDDADITKKIEEEVIRQLKIKRKTPSKGEVRDKPSILYGISNKGYEVKTIKN